MILTVTEELLSIFREIRSENKCLSDWALIESDDTFQTDHFIGGFDATENEFCFAYRPNADEEFLFQLSLDEIHRILKAEKGEIELWAAD